MKINRLLLLLVSLAASCLVGFSLPEKPVKATWIWQPELISPSGESMLDFAEQQGINLIYLKIDLTKRFSYYRPFIRAANQKGIEVHALGGHPAWALESHRKRIMRLVEWVQEYNQTADADERLHGVHLDIEPYVLPQWEYDRESVLQQWKENLSAFVSAAKHGSDLETSADVAFWLDDHPAPGEQDLSISEWIISKLDHVTVMAYRDQVSGPNGIAALVQDELAMAEEWNKMIIVAINMKEMAAERHTSFYEEGPMEMDRQIRLLTQELGNQAAYAGVAIHDYRYWKQSVDATPKPPAFLSGTYVWHAELAISEKDQIIAFAKEQNLNLLYVRLDLEQPYEAYRDFVRDASAAGIEVHAMGGHPVWALEENRPRIMRLVNWVKAYNSKASRDEQFRGIHLDIEPYVLPDWSTQRDQVLLQWMDNIKAFVAETKTDANLEASADLAIWLDHVPVPDQPEQSFSEWMISQLDHVTLMAFRDKAEGPGGIMHVAQNELEYADSLGKKLIIAVEIKESAEGEFITFHEEGKGEMGRQLQILRNKVTHKSFRGVAVHAYEYWSTARE